MKSSIDRNYRARPTLESLEPRLVLDNTTFVHNIYHDLLNRAPDPSGNALWISQLNSGFSRQLLSIFFWRSVEHRQLEVNAFYQNILGRAPDGPGNSAVMAMLRAGEAAPWMRRRQGDMEGFCRWLLVNIFPMPHGNDEDE